MNTIGRDAEIFWDQLKYLEGDEGVLVELMPILNGLVVDLISLPRSQYGRSMLPLFKQCILCVNALAVSIETIERESLLDVLYRLGELVSIPRDSYYLEAWRGDW
jgi:hypothetical protein